ncbi:hypothetical protein AXF42_Ash014407 [Apostasia shenzhenica]|uniref:Uncharacterized protein n=1 Tax=Apostasia shenzhenica TaxID=1088818 RepID=A0A2I0B118_9ASPA|nr:hypothetical protein AXF42_Ash014407 [Apostasia shenzhenica]
MPTWVKKRSDGALNCLIELLSVGADNSVGSPLAQHLPDSVCVQLVDDVINKVANILFDEIATKVI